jgi:hypothetical protein
MSHSLTHLAVRLRALGEGVSAGAARLPARDPGGAAFGADRVGALGELGRALHEQWLEALRARAREAAEHGARLRATADDVARAATRYGAVDLRTADRPGQRDDRAHRAG